MSEEFKRGREIVYAVYMIGETKFQKSCVMRQIVKNEKTVNGDLFYRKIGGDALAFKDLVPGMEIDFWWPYKGKDEGGQEENGRFRRAKVIKALVTPPRKRPKACLKRSLLESAHVPKDFFEEENWNSMLTDSIMETAFREETRPTPPSEVALKNRKIVEVFTKAAGFEIFDNFPGAVSQNLKNGSSIKS